jgi:hypothetical protein
MKRAAVVMMAGALVLALAGDAGAGKGKQQKVEGSVVFPAPFADDSGCYAGLHRRALILTQGNNNGIIGYHFDVDKKTWNKPFSLEVTGGQGDVDLDIYFYLADYGTVEQVVTDPLAAGAPPSMQYNTREPGGEAAIVPKQAKHVIVCMYGGQQGAGFDASFTYTAGKGVKAPKK